MEAYAPPAGLDELLQGYAAGWLPPSLRLLAQAHAVMRAPSAAFVGSCEAMGGALLEAEPIAPLGDSALSAVLGKLNTDDGAEAVSGRSVTGDGAPLPSPLGAVVGGAEHSVPWRFRLPGVREHALSAVSEPGVDAKLIKFQAGRRMPEHGHHGAEITLVLQGSYLDDDRRYAPGDVHFMGEDDEHQPQVDPGQDCVCYTVIFGGIRFKRPVRQFLGYLLQ